MHTAHSATEAACVAAPATCACVPQTSHYGKKVSAHSARLQCKFISATCVYHSMARRAGIMSGKEAKSLSLTTFLRVARERGRERGRWREGKRSGQHGNFLHLVCTLCRSCRCT